MSVTYSNKILTFTMRLEQYHSVDYDRKRDFGIWLKATWRTTWQILSWRTTLLNWRNSAVGELAL